MKLTSTAIADVMTLTPPRFDDGRGFFAESFRAEWFPGLEFRQDNHSFSSEPDTIRGLHYQLPPHEQAKLVRVVHGSIRDVAVDLRAGSPTYLQHVAVELSASNGVQLFVPAGFAHGFVTLDPNTVVLYKVTDYYHRDSERGIPWDDPTLAVQWRIDRKPVLSERDRGHPLFDPAAPPFAYVRR